MIHDIPSFLDRNLPSLIEEIKKIKEEKVYESLPTTKVFKDFIKNLNELIPPFNNWEEDKPFLQLIEVVNEQIIRQLIEEEQNMNPESAVAAKVAVTKTILIMGGVIGLIGIGLYAYRCQQNKDNKKGGLLDKEKNKEVFREIKEGFPSFSKKTDTRSQAVSEPTLIYKQYVLLLVTEANRLDSNLKENSRITKDAAEKIIADATFAYCFVEDNSEEGQAVLNAVDCSDEPINYESQDRVFLQLSLSAKPEIMAEKADKLAIRQAMQPNQMVNIKALKKLKTVRSLKAFHSI